MEVAVEALVLLGEPPALLAVPTVPLIEAVAFVTASFTLLTWFFELKDNDALASLDGFDALTVVDGAVTITGNPSLPAAEACAFEQRVDPANAFGQNLANNGDGGTCP
jgi:hypothetical protein